MPDWPFGNDDEEIVDDGVKERRDPMAGTNPDAKEKPGASIVLSKKDDYRPIQDPSKITDGAHLMLSYEEAVAMVTEMSKLADPRYELHLSEDGELTLSKKLLTSWMVPDSELKEKGSALLEKVFEASENQPLLFGTDARALPGTTGMHLLRHILDLIVRIWQAHHSLENV